MVIVAWLFLTTSLIAFVIASVMKLARDQESRKAQRDLLTHRGAHLDDRGSQGDTSEFHFHMAQLRCLNPNLLSSASVFAVAVLTIFVGRARLVQEFMILNLTFSASELRRAFIGTVLA